MLDGAKVGWQLGLDHVEAECRANAGQVHGPDWYTGQDLLPRRIGKLLIVVHGR